MFHEMHKYSNSLTHNVMMAIPTYLYKKTPKICTHKIVQTKSTSSKKKPKEKENETIIVDGSRK